MVELTCSYCMRHESVSVGKPRFDFKAAGYLVSIASVFALGAVAWPKGDDPKWSAPLLVVGMASSIIGMGLRYLAHLKARRALRETQAEARSS